MSRLSGATLLIFFILSAIVGILCWPYTINTWLVFFGKAAVFTWWQGALIGLIPALGQIGIFLAIFTWILMMFL